MKPTHAVGWAIASVAIIIPAVAGSGYIANIGVVALIFVMLGVSFNLIFGMTGYLALTHTASFGVGAYAAGVAATSANWGFVANLVTAMAVTAGGAAILGAVFFRRVRAFPFAIVTLGVTITLWVVAGSWIDVTRGPLGLPGIPRPSFGDLSFSSPISYFYLGAVLTGLMIAACWLISRTDTGLVLRAIRDNERMTSTLGIDTYRYKLATYVVASAMAGATGVYYAHYLTVVSPDVFFTYWITIPLVIVHIGGLGHMPAVIAVAVALAVIPEFLRTSQAYQQLLYGLALVGSVTLVPKGIGGWWAERRRRQR